MHSLQLYGEAVKCVWHDVVTVGEWCYNLHVVDAAAK